MQNRRCSPNRVLTRVQSMGSGFPHERYCNPYLMICKCRSQAWKNDVLQSLRHGGKHMSYLVNFHFFLSWSYCKVLLIWMKHFASGSALMCFVLSIIWTSMCLLMGAEAYASRPEVAFSLLSLLRNFHRVLFY